MEQLNKILPWVIKLVPALVDLFDAEGVEAKAIAGQKLLLEAARHKTDLDLEQKHRGEHHG